MNSVNPTSPFKPPAGLASPRKEERHPHIASAISPRVSSSGNSSPRGSLAGRASKKGFSDTLGEAPRSFSLVAKNSSESDLSLVNRFYSSNPRVKFLVWILQVAKVTYDEKGELSKSLEHLTGVKSDFDQICTELQTRSDRSSHTKVSLVAQDLKKNLENLLTQPENASLDTLKQLLQWSVTSLSELAEKEEVLLPHLRECLEQFLKRPEDIDLFTAGELDRFLNEVSYTLPPKPQPLSPPYELFLHKMALLCIEHPEGEFKKMETGTSSGVYRISLKGKPPLFIFKPCIEEPKHKVYPKGECALREYYCLRERIKCALVKINEGEGFLSEFFPQVIGTVQYFQQALPDQINAAKDSSEKAELEHKAAMARAIDLHEAKYPYDLKIWEHVPRLKMQKMMLEALWDVDYDLNQGNFLVQAVEHDNIYKLLNLINIDRGHALPSRPFLDNETVRIWQPGWKNCSAAHEPVESSVEEEFRSRDPYLEALALKDKIPSMTKEGLALIVLTRWYIQIGLEHHFTIAELLPCYLDNKIFNMMPDLELIPEGGKRARIKFRNKCLQYLRTLVLPPTMAAKLSMNTPV